MYASVNGFEFPLYSASLSIEDRGTVFADSVYEVIAVIHGIIIDLDPHMERLIYSSYNLRIDLPMPIEALKLRIKDHIQKQKFRNGLSNYYIYLQLSRGSMTRSHHWGNKKLKPNWFIWSQPIKLPNEPRMIQVMSTEDTRWHHVHIKSTNLLPNCMAKQEAFDNNFDDSWFYDNNGNYLEASSANIWIIKNNTILTPPLSNRILAGIVRKVIKNYCINNKMKIIEKHFTLSDIKLADEAFQTNTTNIVASVIKIDKNIIGTGRTGPITQKLFNSIKTEYLTVN